MNKITFCVERGRYMAVMTRNNSDKRVIRTKKAIRTALFKLMESKDIASITISELTTLANVNRRTFYTHYSNITAVSYTHLTLPTIA